MTEQEQLTMNKWEIEKNPLILRRMGKTGEELNELGNVTNRIIIQGMDSVDPSSKMTNRMRLQHEIADVYAQLDECVEKLKLDDDLISARRAYKRGLMHEWEELY